MTPLEPLPEHTWLQQLVGEWTFKTEANMGPGQPTQTLEGRESVRPFGNLWVLCEGQGEMPGGGVAQNLMTLGYDPAKQRFVGTFIATVMTHLWIYDGSLDAERRVLALESVGPSFTSEAAMAEYRDVIEILDTDRRTLSSYVLGENGDWTHFMTATYQRVGV